MLDPDLLRIIGQFALAIFILFLLGSGALNRLFDLFISAALAEDNVGPEKVAKGKRNQKAPVKEQKRAFWSLVAILGVAVLLDAFVFPSRYRLSVEWLTQLVVAAFEFGALLIFFGPLISFGRANWFKLTFWVSILTTISSLLWINHLLHLDIRHPRGLFGLLFLSFVQFCWLFGFLGRIDRNEAVPQT